MVFEVEGHSAERAHLWGHLVGEVPLELTDGAGEDLVVLGLEVESWPRF